MENNSEIASTSTDNALITALCLINITVIAIFMKLINQQNRNNTLNKINQLPRAFYLLE